MEITPYRIAERYLGLSEIPGEKNHPFVQWCFSLCNGYGLWTPDEEAWCSAFMQHPCYELGLRRSKSARARSWLLIGERIPWQDARVGFDVVVLKRGQGLQPGAEVTEAQGHVGWLAGFDVVRNRIRVLAGNQGNKVSIADFAVDMILSVQRLG